MLLSLNLKPEDLWQIHVENYDRLQEIDETTSTPRVLKSAPVSQTQFAVCKLPF